MSVAALEIEDTGVYDLPAEVYIADPVKGGSLSRSGARKLLPPSVPAKYREWRENRDEKPSHAKDFGHVAHREVLGVGGPIAVFPKHDARTREGKAIRAEWDAARSGGQTPVLEEDHAKVVGMADALRRHKVYGQPLGDTLLNPERGKPEQTLVWQEMAHGIWWRAMLDWLPSSLTPSGRLIIPDYKTAEDASEEIFAKSIANYGYDMQAAGYSDAARAVGLADEVAFVFVVQEKSPPYLVNVIQLDDPWLKAGRALNNRASEIYAECKQREHKGLPPDEAWPGYPGRVQVTHPPTWLEYRYQAEGIMQ